MVYLVYISATDTWFFLLSFLLSMISMISYDKPISSLQVAALDRMDPDAAAAIGLLPQFGSAVPFDAPLQIRHAVTGLYVRYYIINRLM